MKKIVHSERFYLNTSTLLESLGYCPVNNGIYVREQFEDGTFIWRKEDSQTQVFNGSSHYLEFVRNLNGVYYKLSDHEIIDLKNLRAS